MIAAKSQCSCAFPLDVLLYLRSEDGQVKVDSHHCLGHIHDSGTSRSKWDLGSVVPKGNRATCWILSVMCMALHIGCDCVSRDLGCNSSSSEFIYFLPTGYELAFYRS